MTWILVVVFLQWPPTVIDNGSEEPQCWQGDCVTTVEDGKAVQRCSYFCNWEPEGGWK